MRRLFELKDVSNKIMNYLTFDHLYALQRSVCVKSYTHKKLGHVRIYSFNQDDAVLIEKICNACLLHPSEDTQDFDVVISFGVFSEHMNLGRHQFVHQKKSIVWLQSYHVNDISRYPELKKKLWDLLKSIFIG